jgi:hypothetical protein
MFHVALGPSRPMRSRARRLRRACVAVLVLGLGLGLPAVAAAACPSLFPKLTAAFSIDANTLVLYLGADNFLPVEDIPAINAFDPNVFAPPIAFPPGFTPLLMSITLDPTLIPILKWFLGCEVLEIDTASLASSGLLFPAPGSGPTGATGPTGPPGPPGGGNIYPSALIHTFPRGGVLRIEDSNVAATSVILLQYVGGGGNPSELLVLNVEAGRFTAKGRAGRQFRYVVFN